MKLVDTWKNHIQQRELFSSLDVSETQLNEFYPKAKENLSLKLENKIAEFQTKLDNIVENIEKQKNDVLDICEKFDYLAERLEHEAMMEDKIDQMPTAYMSEFVFLISKLYIHHYNSMKVYLTSQGKTGSFDIVPSLEKIFKDYYFM